MNGAAMNIYVQAFVRAPELDSSGDTIENWGEMIPVRLTLRERARRSATEAPPFYVSLSYVSGFRVLEILPNRCDVGVFSRAPPCGCGKACYCGGEVSGCISFALYIPDAIPLSDLWCANISYHSLGFLYIRLRLSVIRKTFWQ